MTKSLKKNKAQHIEKDREDLRKKRREDFYQKKRYQIVDLRAGGLSMRDIADELEMSIGFVHKWCRRLAAHIHDRIKANLRGKQEAEFYRKSGIGLREAVRSESRAPKVPHRKVTREHVETIIRVRNGRFTKRMGAQKIKILSCMDISHQTINKIMKGLGLTRRYKKRRPKADCMFSRGFSNELWQFDYKILDKRVYMLSIKDDHSRAILTADVRSTWTTKDVIEIFEKAVRLFGTPCQVLSDHGTQWCAVNGGNAAFDEWCSAHGIEHIMGRVRKPTTQGKIERWHGSVLEEAELPPKGSSVDEYRKAVQEYVEHYNNSRPHNGIGRQLPIVVYMGGLILSEVFTNLGVHEVS